MTSKLVGFGCASVCWFQLFSYQLSPITAFATKAELPFTEHYSLEPWLGDLDSNQDKCLQRALSYH